jgi:hypothetical protein
MKRKMRASLIRLMIISESERLVVTITSVAGCSCLRSFSSTVMSTRCDSRSQTSNATSFTASACSASSSVGACTTRHRSPAISRAARAMVGSSRTSATTSSLGLTATRGGGLASRAIAMVTASAMVPCRSSWFHGLDTKRYTSPSFTEPTMAARSE